MVYYFDYSSDSTPFRLLLNNFHIIITKRPHEKNCSLLKSDGKKIRLNEEQNSCSHTQSILVVMAAMNFIIVWPVKVC